MEAHYPECLNEDFMSRVQSQNRFCTRTERGAERGASAPVKKFFIITNPLQIKGEMQFRTFSEGRPY